jgi:drug/metabolite transporter (DMT)-like permease
LAALLLLTAIWGYCNIVIRQLELSLSPPLILVVRYGFVGIAGLPLIAMGPRLPWRRALGGLAVGVLLAVVNRAPSAPV